MEFKIKGWDNLHYNPDKLLGYDKVYNYIISPRALGKTTWFEIKMMWKAYCKEQKSTALLVYNSVDITDALIVSIEDQINKFLVEPVHFRYKKAFNSGVVDIYINDEKILFLRIISLSLPLNRLKKLSQTNIKYIYQDEFIVNTAKGEKYPKDVFNTIREIYNTLVRCNPKLKCYFFGNPYSKYHPYFVAEGFKTSLMTRNSFQTTSLACLHVADLSQELREWLLEHNPDMAREDEYTRYAFEGASLNDERIELYQKQPNNFQLYHVFGIEGKYLYCYRTTQIKIENNMVWWICVRDNIKDVNHIAMCTDFNDLLRGSQLFSPEDRFKYQGLMKSIRFRMVKFETIEAGYLMEEIYTCCK